MSRIETPLPAKREDGMPRRVCMEQLNPAEVYLFDALQAVEMLGADPLLTDAVVSIGNARAYVADWLEGGKKDESFEKRVRDEQAALDGNIQRLSGFIGGEVFKSLPVAEQARLIAQRTYMRAYFEILGERIAAFGRAA